MELKKLKEMLGEDHRVSDNEGYGYHGTVDPEIHSSKKNQSDDGQKRAHLFRAMHGMVRSQTGASPKEAKHYLDSRHGRHLADVHNDHRKHGQAMVHLHNYIKKDYARFKKTYNSEFHESFNDDGQDLYEFFSDQAAPKRGDKVIVKAPSSPHNNKRGTYGGMERGRHVVNHADGTRSFHGDGALIKEDEELTELSTDTLRRYVVKAARDSADRMYDAGKKGVSDHEHTSKQIAKSGKRGIGIVKAVHKMSTLNKAHDEHQKTRKLFGLGEEEHTRSADKKAVTVRQDGKLVVKQMPRKRDVVHPGGKDITEAKKEPTIPQEGHKVKIVAKQMMHSGKTGYVHQVAPQGTHVGVMDKKGNHLGYYHTSDVKVLGEADEAVELLNRSRVFLEDNYPELVEQIDQTIASICEAEEGAFAKYDESIKNIVAEIGPENAILLRNALFNKEI